MNQYNPSASTSFLTGFIKYSLRLLCYDFLTKCLSEKHFENIVLHLLDDCHTLISSGDYYLMTCNLCDAILPRKGPITRTMSKRLQEDWARAAEEGPRVLMNLRVDF